MATFEDGKNTLTNKDYAYQYYINKGLTPIMASAIVGNLVKESGLNTGIIGRADNKGSVGIAQWHSERLDNLKKFAGKNWKALDNQLDFVLHELNTTEQTAYDKLKQAKTVEEATTAFMNHYERPSSDPKINKINDRINEALEVSGSPRSNYTSPNYSFDNSINVEGRPSSLETSTVEYKEPEDPEVVEAKQDIAKKSFQEDLSKLIGAQQQEIVAQPQEVQQNFVPNDLPDPYNYIQQDPGYNFEEFQRGGSIPVSSQGVYEVGKQSVLVPTNGSITMKNVDYPILGISQETGEQIMMQPNQEYFFRDTANVLEVPMKSNKLKNRFK